MSYLFLMFFPPPRVRVLLSSRALPGRGMSFTDSRNKKFAVPACLRRLRIARSRRDLSIAPLERLQLRVWPSTFASSQRNGSWQTHPLAPSDWGQHLCCYLLQKVTPCSGATEREISARSANCAAGNAPASSLGHMHIRRFA